MTVIKAGISKLYLKIIACFLGVVIFSGAVLTFAFYWFSGQNERHFISMIDEAMDGVTRRLDDSVLSLYDLCRMISDNVLVTENFKPDEKLSAANLYYYNSIIELLRQGRLQFDGVVDSVFLYADDKRVLYSANEKGTANAAAFFTNFMRYDTYSEAFWMELLNTTNARFTVLDADCYTNTRVHDKRVVLPLVYAHNSMGHLNVLVMNLSLDKIMAMYANEQVFSDTRMLLFDRDSLLLPATDDAPTADEMRNTERLRYGGVEYYVAHAEQNALGLTLYGLTPVTAFLSFSAYYRFTAISLTAVFVVCGLILSLFMSKRTYAPIREVRENIRNVQASDGAPSRDFISDELAAIKSGINRLASERESFKSRNRQHSWHYITQALAMLLDGRTLTDEMYCSQILMQDYGFQKRGYACAAVVLDAEQKHDYLALNELLDRLNDALLTAFEEGTAIIPAHYQGNMLVLLIDSDGHDATYLRSLLNKAADAFLGDGTCALRVGLGGTVRHLSEIQESFEQALSEVFALPGEEALTSDHHDQFTYDRAEVIGAAATCDLKRIEDVAEEILTQAKRHQIPYRDAAAVTRDIYKTVMDAQRRLSPDRTPINLSVDEDAFNVMEVLLLSPDINLSPLLVALFKHIPYQATAGETGAEDIAHRLKKTIDSHYHEELSLDILADKVGVSGKYLSRVFKQVMGVNLSDYLAYVRIERAKELLATDMPVEKISECVGIFNRTTFTRIFRKLEGMTPSEFRNARRREGG